MWGCGLVERLCILFHPYNLTLKFFQIVFQTVLCCWHYAVNALAVAGFKGMLHSLWKFVGAADERQRLELWWPISYPVVWSFRNNSLLASTFRLWICNSRVCSRLSPLCYKNSQGCMWIPHCGSKCRVFTKNWQFCSVRL